MERWEQDVMYRAQQHRAGAFLHPEGTMLNSLALDYITLTGGPWSELPRIAAWLTGNLQIPELGKVKRMQYTGYSEHGVFFGKGYQNGQEHLMLQVPGLRAEQALQYKAAEYNGVNCSRFDLQVTVPAEDAPNIRSLFNALQNPDTYPWNAPGKPPKATLVAGSDGYDTLYVGNRRNDLFRRIYLKDVGGKPYVRCEVEVKGKLARSLWERGDLFDEGAKATFYRAILSQFPQAIQHKLDVFRMGSIEPTGEYERPEPTEDTDRAIQWWINTVVPAYKKAARGKYRDELVAVLRSHGIEIRMV